MTKQHHALTELQTKCLHTESAESPLHDISKACCQAARRRGSLRNFSLEAYSFSVFSDTIITSRNNPRIRQLRALLKRPERERTGLVLIEGLRLVTEALQYPDLVHQLIVAPELLKSQHGQELLQDQRKKEYEKEEI